MPGIKDDDKTRKRGFDENQTFYERKRVAQTQVPPGLAASWCSPSFFFLALPWRQPLVPFIQQVSSPVSGAGRVTVTLTITGANFDTPHCGGAGDNCERHSLL